MHIMFFLLLHKNNYDNSLKIFKICYKIKFLPTLQVFKIKYIKTSESQKIFIYAKKTGMLYRKNRFLGAVSDSQVHTVP